MTAEYKVHGSVAVITLANPPVNGLGLSTRQGIVDGLDKAQQDAAVKAIVITGAGGAFSGGADPWGFVFAYKQNVVSRGARSLPIIRSGAELYPDVY